VLNLENPNIQKAFNEKYEFSDNKYFLVKKIIAKSHKKIKKCCFK
jgi:hypothetical protein